MALQLGFDGAIKLGNCDDSSARMALELTRDRYEAYVKAIDVGESERSTYWRIMFAVLSVHSPLEATFAAYRSLRLWKARFGRIPTVPVLKRLLLNARGDDGTVTQYCYQKATYLRAFDVAWSKDRTGFVRGDDTDLAWRDRLQRNVKGLGLAKASFAVALSAPSTSDVCCIDTHMYQLFVGKVPTSTISRRQYLELEDKVRALGKEYGLGTFTAQWCLWDAKRGSSNPHSVLATI